jgi:hypothetical protein
MRDILDDAEEWFDLSNQPTSGESYIFDEVERNNAAAMNERMRSVKGKDPNLASKYYAVSDQTGLPVDYVERNYKDASAKEFDYEDLRRRAPLLAQMLHEKRNAELAQAELDNLTWFEEAARETKNALGMVPKAAFSISSAFYSGIGSVASIGETFVRAPVELYRVGAEALGYEEQSKSAAQLSYDLTEISRGSLKIAKKEKEQAKRFDVKPTETRAHPAVWGGVQSVIMNVPAIAASIALRNKSIALGMMGGVSYGDAHLEGKEKGLSDFESFVYGTNNMFAEVVPESFPLGKLLSDIEKNTGFLKMLGKQMVSEVITEQITTVWQDMNKWASINPEKTLQQFIDERPDAAINTLISTLVATGLQTSAIAGIQKLGQGAEQEVIQNIVDKAQESNYKDLDKSNFQSFLQEVAAEYGAVEHLYIDSQEARKAMEQMQDDEAYQLLNEQIDEAEERYGDIVIPVGEFAAIIANSPNYKYLKSSIRVSPDADTVTLNAFERIQEANKSIDNKDEIKRIYDDVSTQLQATKTLTPEASRLSAELYPNFVGAAIYDSELTAQEVYEMMGLKIIGPTQDINEVAQEQSNKVIGLIDSLKAGEDTPQTQELGALLTAQGIDVNQDAQAIADQLSSVQDFKQSDTTEEVIKSDPLLDSQDWKSKTVTATLDDGTKQEMNAGQAYDIINSRKEAAQSILDCINANS